MIKMMCFCHTKEVVFFLLVVLGSMSESKKKG